MMDKIEAMKLEGEKKELAKALRDKLCELKAYPEDGQSDDPFSTEFTISPDWLLSVVLTSSTDNLRAAYDLLATGFTDGNSQVPDWVTTCTKKGLFKPTWYVYRDKSGTSLVLGQNRFMHWFRGYYFQVSYTHQGVGAYCTPPHRLDRALICAEDLFYEEVAPGYAEFVVAANFLSTLLLCSPLSSKHLKVSRSYEICNEFLKSVPNVSADDMDLICYTSLLYSTYQTVPISIDPNNHNCRLVDDGNSFAVVSIDNLFRTVAVIVRCNDNTYHMLTLNIPKWLSIPEDDTDDEHDKMCRHNVLMPAIHALLGFAGIHASYVAMYRSGMKPEESRIPYGNVRDEFSNYASFVDYVRDLL